MQHEIVNPQGGYSVLKTKLSNGEEFFSMPGTVTSLRGTDFASQRKGGLLGGMKRAMMTGTNIYMDKIFFVSEPGESIVAPRFPGQIGEIELKEDMFAHSHSFLAAENGVEIGSRSLGVRSLFANGSLFWITLQQNPGKKAWLSFFGDIIKMNIPEGEKISVEHGHFVALSANANFQLRYLGIKRAMLSGEGLYMVDIQGPAELWLQTRNLEAFIQMVAVEGGPRR